MELFQHTLKLVEQPLAADAARCTGGTPRGEGVCTAPEPTRTLEHPPVCPRSADGLQSGLIPSGSRIMPLQRGTRLGPYQIESPIGAEGMGEVYKATDTRLERTVGNVCPSPSHRGHRIRRSNVCGTGSRGLPRSLLKFSGDSVHDYATICAESPRPSLASRARSATTSCGTPV